MYIIKKLLSFGLVLALLATLLLPVQAATISIGQPQSVTVVDDETPAVLQFTPTVSGYYVFYSFHSKSSDPSGYIMDDNKELLAQGDDTEAGMDFSISCYMTAGKTYYLAATCYSGSAQYTVQVDRLPSPTAMQFDQNNYTGAMGKSLYPEIIFSPADCAREAVTFSTSNEQVVRITEDGTFVLGIPGTATVTATSFTGLTAICTVTVTPPQSLALNTPWTLDATLGEQYLQFTAPADGWYGIVSEGDEIDPWVEVLDAGLEGLTEDDERLPGDNFFAPVYLQAGQLCYFCLNTNNSSGTAQVTLKSLTSANTITLPDQLTGYSDTVCWLSPVYTPAVAIPEALNWTSSDETVVCVDSTGLVSFRNPGKAQITVTSETGKTDTVTVTVLPAPTDANLLDWGICGDNLQWRLTTSGTLTVTGSGDMYDLYNNPCHWDQYASQITQVLLPNTLTSIGYGAFLDCLKLTELRIPDSVRRIGGSAFSNCYALTQVTLPGQLEYLGPEVFDYCVSLSHILLPQSLKRLPNAVFRGCSALQQITLPGSLASIGDEAFADCAIPSIALPDSLKTIGFSAFSGAGLTQITLPDGLAELRDYAFVNCNLEELTIPASVTKLGCGFVTGNPIHTLRFLGNAPVFDSYALDYLTATAFYPAANRTWTEQILQNYGGSIQWTAEGNPGVTLSGSVKAGVSLTLSLGTEVLEITAEAGSYTFLNLLPGTYTLTATAQNHVPHSYTITIEEQDLTQDVTLHLIGDIDGNGKVNIGDVAKINAHIKGTSLLTDPYALECANINGGKLNIGDSAALYSHIRGTKKLY